MNYLKFQGRFFSLPYVAKNVNEIVSYVNMVEELMEARYSKKALKNQLYF